MKMIMFAVVALSALTFTAHAENDAEGRVLSEAQMTNNRYIPISREEGSRAACGMYFATLRDVSKACYPYGSVSFVEGIGYFCDCRGNN